ncbi:hypothetical protein CBL_05033 [Carabus blaptoides fortunei]
MDNDVSKEMSEELKEINNFNFKQRLQKRQFKSEEIMAPDIQLSKLQNMIRAQLMKNNDRQNKETNTTCVIEEPGTLSNQNNVKIINKKHSIKTEILKHAKIEETKEINLEQNWIKHEKEIVNDNNLNNVNIDNNSFNRTKNSELNNGNIKIKPILESTSKLLNQENIGATDTAHGNIEYSFANIITTMAQIHGEECDINMLTNINLSCDKPEDMEEKHTDNIQPKLTKLVEVMRKKLQDKLNHTKPDANINKQSSNSENKCESVDADMKRNSVGLSAEHCVTVKRACKTSTELDKIKHLCTICKAEFTNSSDFASHLLKCEINKRILRSRHNMSKYVEKHTCKCTRTRGKKRKI